MGDFTTRLDAFCDVLREARSKWEVQISCPDDILLSIKSHGERKILASFGEASKDVLGSDYVFTLFPKINLIKLPKEVFWDKYDQYAPSALLGVFELTRPGFIASKNVYFKIPISNSMSLSSFTRKRTPKIGEFRTPTGQPFDDSWHIGNIGLPVQEKNP